MKKYTLLVIVMWLCFAAQRSTAQTRIVTTVAGCMSCSGSSSGDNIPATDATLWVSTGVIVDAAGNIYYADGGGHKVRKVDASTGLVHTIAGTGIIGNTGDGGPATAARLGWPRSISLDPSNNLYIVDSTYGVIRKVSASTGLISTYSLTGMGTPIYITIDRAGNIYGVDAGVLKKKNASTGAVTTIASGVGNKSVVVDTSYNVYYLAGVGVAKYNNATGTTTIVAGGGTSIADGVPASTASLAGAQSIGIDSQNNLYIAYSTNLLRMVDASGTINTIGGCGNLWTDGLPAFATFLRNYMIYVTPNGDIYYSDYGGHIRKVSYNGYSTLTFVADSFTVQVDRACNGPSFRVSLNGLYAAMTVKTFFGDGQSISSSFSTSCAGGMIYAAFSHHYQFPGTYTIKNILYNGTTVVDSLICSYEHVSCNTISLKYYLDDNNNCQRDSNEHDIFLPSLTEIDSNGVIIDTIAATGNAYYNARGTIGDIYTLKLISMSRGFTSTCPISGLVSDTITSDTLNPKYVAIYGSHTSFDMATYTISRTGPHAQRNDIYCFNYFCAPMPAILTFTFSNRFPYFYSTSGAATTGNTAIWPAVMLTADTTGPAHFYCELFGASLALGDTVHSKSEISPSDTDPTNNVQIVVDTARAGLDPNYITAANCIPVNTDSIQYTIHFENTGNDTAHNIYVLDTISSNLDPHSMRIVMASAQMTTSINKIGAYTIAKFDFPNIKLLDSSHHGLCDGVFIYTIKPKAGLADGAAITNQAGIYFDINPVVMTNTATTTIGCPWLNVPSVTSGSKVVLYPNPTTDELTIQTEPGAYQSFTITNSLGQILIEQSITGTRTTTSVDQLPDGLYFVTLRGDKGIKTERFVKTSK